MLNKTVRISDYISSPYKPWSGRVGTIIKSERFNCGEADCTAPGCILHTVLFDDGKAPYAFFPDEFEVVS